MIIYFSFGTSALESICHLRGSLPKSGPLDFATKNTLFFVGEEALVGIY